MIYRGYGENPPILGDPMSKPLTRLDRIERFIETKIFRLPVRPNWI